MQDSKKLLSTYLKEQIAKAIGISCLELDKEQPFKYLGIDSLIATKLRNKLRNEWQVDVPAVKFLGDLTVSNLAALLNEQLEKKQLISIKSTPTSHSDKTRFPLTYGQQGLWFLYKLAPLSAAYNIAFTAKISSNLNILALRKACQQLITRHPTLRTTFAQENDEPYQQIQSNIELDFEIIDAQEWDWNQLKEQAIAAYRRPFNLEQDPILRVTLFTRSLSEHLLLLTIHHIAVDGFSFGIILDELRLLYQAETTGQKVSLPPIQWHYQDFVNWQKEMLASPRGDKLWTYWQQQLSGELPILKLPTSKPRPLLQNYQGASYTFELPDGLTTKLKELAKTQGVTLYVTLLTAYYILLHRYTAQDDIIVGSPTEGRSQTEFSQTVGFFVNMLALRGNLAGNPRFSELLAQVRQTVLAALTHQDYPSPLLIERLQLNRDYGLPELFRVSFNLLKLSDIAQDYELSVNEKAKQLENWGGLSLEPFVIPQQEGQNDLVLDIIETTESLLGIIRYSSDLFEEKTITRMAGHFQTLLEAIITHPEEKIGLLPLLTKAEQIQLRQWNNNQLDYPENICIHQLFEEQVKLTPDAVAVTFKNQQLSYQELNTRTNQLAGYLQKLGVGAEVLVGICLERSLEMIIGMLAILKAGGAYVPLDAAYPKERLNYMIADSGIDILLTQEKLLQDLPDNIHLVCLDRECFVEEEYIPNTSTSDNLAYVIYTSGSTGKAKGVAIAHKSLVSAYSAWASAYQLRCLTSHLQMASFSFDVFTGDWVRALCSGAKLVLCPREWLLEPSKLYSLMRQEKIDAAEFVPAVLRNLVEYLQETGQNLDFMRLLVVGSESFSVREYQQFQGVCGEQTRLINSYGVTEATIDSAYEEVKKENLSPDKAVPIGYPFANTHIYILDRYLQPVPAGIEGQLYIGGNGLARCYLNRPDLTSETFIFNPFIESKLYKTGDLGRYLPDGTIELLGRIDHQVKIRGYRIELGEIEAVLTKHPQIREAVVSACDDQIGNKYLVAYLVFRHESISNNELFDFLKHKLPDYMIPSAFVILDALPLSPNGKIDRRALPKPDELQNQLDFVAPRTAREKAIATIFASILRLKKVGIHDNFFQLGGHSLLATQVISRLQQRFKVEFPLRKLLEFPTVAGIAQNLNDFVDEIAPLPAIVPTPESRYQPFPLTDIQQAYWLGRSEAFELGNIAAHGYLEIDTYNLEIERLNLAWQKLILRHDMLRVVILPNGQQQVLESVPPYQIEVLELEDSTQLEAIRHQMSHEVLSSEEWPLFKIRASRLDAQRIRLHLSFDALTGDAWSLFLLMREWFQLYQNPEFVLPPLELSFRDYVLAQELLKDTPNYHRSQEYWFSRLDSLPPAPDLPLAKNPSLVTTPQFKRRVSQLSSSDWKQLKDRANQYNLTPSGVLLSAFAQILSRWSKSAKFTINLTLFNRLPLHPQVNDIVGDFTTLTLLEIDHSTLKPYLTHAQNLQQQLWQDLDHGYVSGLQVQRELSRRRGSYQLMPVVFTSTLGLDALDDNQSMLNQLGEIVYSISQTPQVWLDHQVREQNGTLLFNWDAVEELFPDGLLDDMFKAYCDLLQQLVSSESIWTETYQIPVQTKVNHTDAPVSEQKLHDLFINQVQYRANEPAVITQNLTLTYQQLYQRSLQLAYRLRHFGTSPNTLVAVVMEKGWEQIVAVLGILMSGAAYLPIDSTLPQERQEYLLAQGQVKLVVTQHHLNLSFPSKIECLWVENEELKTDSSLEFLQSIDDLAYVIYTSGSTGLPKGVMIDHKGAVNTILDINQRFRVGASDRIFALSALNFDLSVYDIFGILAVGGAIVIPEPEDLKNPAQWLELMISEGVTLWNSVPTLMQMLVEYLSAQPQALLSLRLALLSGDWLPLRLPEQVKALASNVEVVSLGGATEASIWSIFYPINKVESHWNSIPYGKPLTNQQIYVLNELMQPCPVWVSGQLYIGGIGLAKGYWGDEEKTKDRFIIHPITQERLYKTGDLGRYLPDGNIEFLGREDFQIKINGHRIELGEIESILQQHPAIKQAVVTVVEAEKNKQLFAYVVLENKSENTGETYQPRQLKGVLTNPVEVLEFKLKQPGLRQIESEQISIPLPKSKSQDYLTRQSYRQFLSQPISLKQFANFLSCLSQLQLNEFPLPKYLYPSAGSLYPVQVYLFVKPNGIDGLEAGIYYYNPTEHHLVLISATREINSRLFGDNKPIFEQSAFEVFLIGKLDAIAPIYGELARDFCLLEAGHIGQLLMNTAPAEEIGLCPIGYLEFEQLKDLFKLESNQVLLYSFVGGKIDLEQTKKWLEPKNNQSSRSIIVQLKEYLQQKLPLYMIPSDYIVLDALPLTSNGKINRQMLPTANLSLKSETVLVPPQTETEKTLVTLIQELIKTDVVGIDKNFFELGLDSLKIVQLKNKLQTQLGINISMRQLLGEATNIAELSLLVDEQITLAKIKQEPQLVNPNEDKERFTL